MSEHQATCPVCGGTVEQSVVMCLWECHGCGFTLTQLERVRLTGRMPLDDALEAKKALLLAGGWSAPR